MWNVTKIPEDEAISILNEEEDHFFDFIRKDYVGEAVQKKCVAFANADGGELLIGIYDKKEKSLPGGKFERWSGFNVQEDANNVIADISKNINPALPIVNFEFLEIEKNESNGKVLRVIIEKSQDVHATARGNVYVRTSAQCTLISDQSVTDLQLSKGSKSFENQNISGYDLARLTDSTELKDFLNYYFPKTDPKNFLKKQSLITCTDDSCNPIYAGVLMYDENPSAVLPKKCALKITRYDTSEQIPKREHLKDQKTIEGPVHRQIIEGVREIQRIVNSVPIMGPTGLEKAKYPPEAIFEILVNALIHRDYNISDDVSVMIFNNRIEVHSTGPLRSFITPENILDKRFSRNAKIVRLLNKYPDRPNHDIGEGLNTAFQKMREVRLKDPIIKNSVTEVLVVLPHEYLAAPEDQIIQYLDNHDEITNEIARSITGIESENKVKACFYRLRDRGIIEMVPDKKGVSSAWRKSGKDSDKAPNTDSNKNIEQSRLF